MDKAMASNSRDLWPDTIATTDIKPPVAILREQAALLAQKTNGLVEGKVTTTTDSGRIIHSFFLVAPALGQYRYQLFWVAHDITLYPVGVYFDAFERDAPSEEELLRILKEIFFSETTLRVVHSLVAQSRSA
jgi:hypothetical protein